MLLSLDLSTKSTGYAVYDGYKLIKYGCLCSSKDNVMERIAEIGTKVVEVIEDVGSVSKIIVEEVRPATQIDRHTNRVLMWLQGYVAMKIWKKFNLKLDIFLLPSEWRKVCGIKQGKQYVREKQKVEDIAWVKKTFGLEVNDDVADAIGIGYAYLHGDEASAFGVGN